MAEGGRMKWIRLEGSIGIGEAKWARISAFTYLWCLLNDCVTRVRWTKEKLPTYKEIIYALLAKGEL